MLTVNAYGATSATEPLVPMTTQRYGYVSVAHAVQLPGEELFYAEVHLQGGPAPVRRFLPQLISGIADRSIDPGKAFDLTLPLDHTARGYRQWTNAAP